ncbi:selenium-binding protein SBP56-related protein [Cupriavidus basilensis]
MCPTRSRRSSRGKVRIGGIVSRATHPGAKNGAHAQWRAADGRAAATAAASTSPTRFYGAVDPQFYPEGIDGWMAKLDAAPEGGLSFDPKFFIEWPDKGPSPAPGTAAGRSCSSDSYCCP